MERSFVNKYGKWIVSAVIVLALALWFILSNNTENYAHKYEGVDLSVSTEGIGRDNTYELYLSGSIIPVDISAAAKNAFRAINMIKTNICAIFFIFSSFPFLFMLNNIVIILFVSFFYKYKI